MKNLLIYILVFLLNNFLDKHFLGLTYNHNKDYQLIIFSRIVPQIGHYF